MGGKTYEGRFLREISFPLGGIGAGSIGLAGNGRLIDWETFNRPNRQSVNGYTNFAIKAERDGEVRDAIQGNIAVLKSYTCMRLTKGEFYAFEYTAAFNMLMHATENEALEIVRAVRERYDGYKRNPWSEIECGTSYARAMASYSFVIAYSGFTYDLSERYIGFDPVHFGEGYSTFWSVGKAFGKFMFRSGEITLEVLYGEIKLKRLGLPESVKRIIECNISYTFTDGAAEVAFTGRAGDKLIFGIDSQCLY